jgi:hypothetical protein
LLPLSCAILETNSDTFFAKSLSDAVSSAATLPSTNNEWRRKVADFEVTAIRAPDLDDDEVRRRLGRVYRIILDYKIETTADGGEFGDLTPSTADDVPTWQPATREIL